MRRDFSSPNFNQNAGGPPNNQQYITENGNVPQAFHRNFYTRSQPNPILARLIEQRVERAESLDCPESIGNPDLPIYAYQDEIVETVQNNPVTIIISETGSGKTTQTPQFLQNAGYEVSITQPRRIATYSIAERISEEVSDRIGKEAARDLVGYQTAEKSTVTADTKITLLTDGIETMHQFYDKPSPVPSVDILDEVHEWNTNIELAVALIKQNLHKYPNKRYVLMSATMDGHRAANYFAEATGRPVPVIEVPGRTFDIDHVVEPESVVVDEVVKSASENPDDDILVFVPGKREIQDTIDGILAKLPRHIAQSATVLPLHAKLNQIEQARINNTYSGIKIIVSTNVAQTSLTVDGINVVIDCGLERRVELDIEGVEGLKAAPISQADCDQRKGRTGRTAPGKYVFTRYDKDSDFIPYELRPQYAEPEILRTDLVRSVLRAEAVGIDLEKMDLFHPVKFGSIRRAKQSLMKLGALDENEAVTSLGVRMNEFPVKPSSARMIVESGRFSPNVTSYVAAIAASIEVGGLPYFSHDTGKAWQQFIEETKSDHLAQLELFIASQGMTDKQLSEYNFDVKNIKRAQELHRKIVHRSNASIGELIPPSVKEKEQIREAVLAGLVDSVYVHAGGGRYGQIGSDAEIVDREISDRSVVWKQRPKYIVGSPYRVEFMKNGLPDARHIVESVTIIDDPRILGRIATKQLIEIVPTRIELSAGKLMQISQTMFRGVVSLGIETVEPASDSEATRAFMREHVLNNPGPAQRSLREIKRELETLQHYTHKKLNLLTQDALSSLIDEVISEGALEESHIDSRLREIVEERKITIHSFESAQRIAAIRKKSPTAIDINGNELHVRYARGNPRVLHYSEDVLENLPSSVTLKDGREVRFMHERKWYTAAELKKVISKS